MIGVIQLLVLAGNCAHVREMITKKSVSFMISASGKMIQSVLVGKFALAAEMDIRSGETFIHLANGNLRLQIHVGWCEPV